MSPNLVLDRVQWDRFEQPLTWRNGSSKRGWDGGVEGSQPSRTPDTSHANDIRRQDGTPTLAVPAVGWRDLAPRPLRPEGNECAALTSAFQQH